MDCSEFSFIFCSDLGDYPPAQAGAILGQGAGMRQEADRSRSTTTYCVPNTMHHNILCFLLAITIRESSLYRIVSTNLLRVLILSKITDILL